MPQKNKWFKRIVIPLPEIFSMTEIVSEEMATGFFKALGAAKLGEPVTSLLHARYLMAPDVRLAVNIKALVSQLIAKHKNVHSVIPDGLTDKEHDALVLIAERGVDPITNAIAHSLFNIEERNAALLVLRPLFDETKKMYRTEGTDAS
tara:strand:+ start:1034 stop:1477 length:444 start_codon:yes stop_codon:yes gene_type:complete